MAKFTYTEDAGDGSTYGNGHHTQTLFVCNEDTQERRKYDGWTYMDVDYYDADMDEASELDVDEDMQMACEELQYILNAIWEGTDGYEDMSYTTV